MTALPPPDAVVLVLSGLRGSMDHAAVRDAIERFDPAARVWTNWPQAMIAVETAAPPEALRAAVQDAGYIAAIRHSMPRPGDGPGAGEWIMRLIGFTFSGFVVGTLVAAGLGVANVVLNPSCNIPGDAGGCAMGIPAMAIGGGMLGAPIGFVLALVRRRRR